MKENITKLLCCCAVIFIAACTDSGTKYADYDAGASPATKADSTALSTIETKSAAVVYAEGIISGKIKLAENNESFAWLDSLQSENKITRQLAYNVTEVIINKGQGFLAESAGGHLKSYLQLYPKEFLANYRNASATMQKKLIENCAYEFYASGTDYAADIENYFKEIAKACMDCTAEDNGVLNNFKAKLESLVKSKND